jgi:hypothetical protein
LAKGLPRVIQGRGGPCGGPSIISNRDHEADKMKIRGLYKLCKKIIGYDSNALYLWAIAQEMRAGKHITNYKLTQLNQDI